jgi:Lrp/AsnC family transcriptional regulator for asnA, asnC and gidA
MTIDSLDKQLIDLLMQDAHRSSDVLAKQLNVSSSTVRRRMKRLLEQGVIRFIAFPDRPRVGLPVTAVIALSVSHDKVASVLKALSKYPRSRWVAATSGRFNVMSHWWLSSTEELYRFMENEIGKLEGIVRTETFISLYTEKSPNMIGISII